MGQVRVAERLLERTRSARRPRGCAEAARTAAPALIILDLNSARIQPLAIVEALKADAALAAVPTVGFVSHVDTATIEAARRAGVGRVLARSAFVEQLSQLLASAHR